MQLGMGVIFVDFTGLLFFSDIFDVILQLCYLPIDPLHSLIVLKVCLLKDVQNINAICGQCLCCF